MIFSLSLSLSLYIYIYIYTYKHVYTYINISLSLYIYIYIYICVYTYIYTYVYRCRSLPLYLSLYISLSISLSLYIYIYIYGGFPRPATTKVAKGKPFDERNEESIPYESKTRRGSMKKAYSTLLGYAFLARFGVCFGGTLRGYASGSVEVPPPLKSPNNQFVHINFIVFP